MALFEKRSAPAAENVQGMSSFPGLSEILGFSLSGAVVNPTTAMRVASVYSCVDAIAKDSAGLPIQVKRKTVKDGRVVVEKVTGHPLTERLKLRPNPEDKAFDMRRDAMWQLLLNGNRYAFVERSTLNPVKALWPLHPDAVNVIRKQPTKGSRGKIVYNVMDGYSRKIYRPENILHVKTHSTDGLKGDSIITQYARNQIGIGLSMDEFESNFFKNGMNAGGVLTHPKKLGADNKGSFLKALRERFGGNKKSHLPLVLENGMTFTPYDIKMADQEFLELLRINKADICGIFGVPQSRIGISDANTNYNNTEQENRRYVQSGLLPWAIPDEQEMDWKLLTAAERADGFFIKYNFDAMLRGDTATQTANDEKLWCMGVPINDLLARRDENPVPGGDIGRVQMNTVSLTKADEEPTTVSTKGKRSVEKRSASNDNAELVVAGRDKITKRLAPLVRAAAQKIVNRESIAVKKQVKKLLGERTEQDFDGWIDKFYSKFPDYIRSELGPALRTYAESMADMVAGEIDLEEITGELEADIDTYIEGFVAQYISSSEGQLRALATEEGLDAVDLRVDEWHEKRADKVSLNETVGIGNMVARSLILGAGYKLIWHTRGDSCPFCKQLHGRTVSKTNEPFLKSGTIIGDGEKKMTVKQTLYAPLHRGCDCVVMAG